LMYASVDRQLWSQNYERALSELQSLQRELPASVRDWMNP